MEKLERLTRKQIISRIRRDPEVDSIRREHKRSYRPEHSFIIGLKNTNPNLQVTTDILRRAGLPEPYFPEPKGTYITYKIYELKLEFY